METGTDAQIRRLKDNEDNALEDYFQAPVMIRYNNLFALLYLIMIR